MARLTDTLMGLFLSPFSFFAGITRRFGDFEVDVEDTSRDMSGEESIASSLARTCPRSPLRARWGLGDTLAGFPALRLIPCGSEGSSSARMPPVEGRRSAGRLTAR